MDEIIFEEQNVIVDQIQVLNELLHHNYDAEGEYVGSEIFDEIDTKLIKQKIMNLVKKIDA